MKIKQYSTFHTFNNTSDPILHLNTFHNNIIHILIVIIQYIIIRIYY